MKKSDVKKRKAQQQESLTPPTDSQTTPSDPLTTPHKPPEPSVIGSVEPDTCQSTEQNPPSIETIPAPPPPPTDVQESADQSVGLDTPRER